MNSRQQAIELISQRKDSPLIADYKEEPFKNCYGKNVFHLKAQMKYLSKKTFDQLHQTIIAKEPLSLKLADEVAKGICKWAIDQGATHFCHWFQPLTDLTAEKHDTLFSVKNGKLLAQFDGSSLVLGEPDASSFPTGGLRTTFEARGYTAWDPSSPAFILDAYEGKVLVIPTLFLSWNSEALDKKIPLLRSIKALQQQSLKMLKCLGDKKARDVTPTVGAEQEYFLIDKVFYLMRPDLMACGRTLFGASPYKGQELEDQYLGSIPKRVLHVMSEVEHELMCMGIPVKTRHNEVAPSQYELALHYEVAHLASDHQMIVMETIKRVAEKHQMIALLHEKPFGKVNGSGKHLNWSLAKDEKVNLLNPGSTAAENIQFLTFLLAVILGVYEHADLLRASIASVGNDHRLGMHEAPPAIISVFVGQELFEIINNLARGKTTEEQAKTMLDIKLDIFPKIPRHASDRNRTSPFAFTGDKFEFRAVGSRANIARPITMLNAVVTDALGQMIDAIEAKKKELPIKEALFAVLCEVAKKVQPILFEGDNYSEAWVKEAKKRKLPNIPDALRAFDGYLTSSCSKLMEQYAIYTEQELESLATALRGDYTQRRLIEARAAIDITKTMVIPSAVSYREKLVVNRSAGRCFRALFREYDYVLNQTLKELDRLEKVYLASLRQTENKRPEFIRDKLLGILEALRVCVDTLEHLVDDTLWPLPKYREMLLIR